MKIKTKSDGAAPVAVMEPAPAPRALPVKRPSPSKPPLVRAQSLKLPPSDLDSEMAVLGAMIVESSAIRAARQYLRQHHFYHKPHSFIFTAMCEMDDRGFGVDVITLAAELKRAGLLDQAGGVEALLLCTQKVATAAHVAYYAKIVAGTYLDRQIIHAATKMAQTQDSENLEKLRQLHLAKETLGAPYMLDYRTGLLTLLEEIMDETKSKVYNTHFPEIDRYWKGMKEGDVNVWAAATNKGKSVMALNLLDRWAMNDNDVGLYVGTEMKAAQTLQRHLAIQSKIEAWKIRKPKLDDREKDQLRQIVVQKMSKMRIAILDDPEPSLEKIEAAAFACGAKRIWIDYLERCSLPAGESLRLQIKEFMRRLKTMAVKRNYIIDLLAQLNRSNYGDVEKPPVLSDLSESSAIEKEADRVCLFWTPKKKQPQDVEGWRVIELIQAKDRSGPCDIAFDLYLSETNLTVMEKTEYDNPFNHKK